MKKAWIALVAVPALVTSAATVPAPAAADRVAKSELLTLKQLKKAAGSNGRLKHAIGRGAPIWKECRPRPSQESRTEYTLKGESGRRLDFHAYGVLSPSYTERVIRMRTKQDAAQVVANWRAQITECGYVDTGDGSGNDLPYTAFKLRIPAVGAERVGVKHWNNELGTSEFAGVVRKGRTVIVLQSVTGDSSVFRGRAFRKLLRTAVGRI